MIKYLGINLTEEVKDRSWEELAQSSGRCLTKSTHSVPGDGSWCPALLLQISRRLYFPEAWTWREHPREHQTTRGKRRKGWYRRILFASGKRWRPGENAALWLCGEILTIRMKTAPTRRSRCFLTSVATKVSGTQTFGGGSSQMRVRAQGKGVGSDLVFLRTAWATTGGF